MKRFSVLVFRTFADDETDTFYAWVRANDPRDAEIKAINKARRHDGKIYDKDEYLPLLTISGHKSGL